MYIYIDIDILLEYEDVIWNWARRVGKDDQQLFDTRELWFKELIGIVAGGYKPPEICWAPALEIDLEVFA